MGASLLELQRRFAVALAGAADGAAAVYRGTVRANYRNALGATYAVVRELTGNAFFDAAVDAFTAEHPSTGGDLNVYGKEFADFLAAYPYARSLPYLPDVARLEWAIDDAVRARDHAASPQEVLGALSRIPGDALPGHGFVLDPSCRLVGSPFPVMRIWQVHQSEGDRSVDLDAGADHVVVRREGDVPSLARVAPSDFAFLSTLADGGDLGSALDAALARDGAFDLAGALRTFIADGTLAGLA